MTITFVNTYAAGITGASAAFQTNFTNTVNAVEAFFNQQFSDTLTLNVTFDYQALNTVPLPGGGFILGSNNFATTPVSYADIRNALIAHQSTNDANPGDDAASMNSLPAIDPATATSGNTVQYFVTNGQEKLLGLNGIGANDDLGADATIAFASDTPNPFDFDPSDGITAGSLDAFATIAHEVSEGLMGRIMRGGGVPTGQTVNSYRIMDLFHYTSGGTQTMLQPAGGGNLFSFSGTTGDPNLNRVLDNSGDIADPSSGADPRNAFADANSGVVQAITQSDLRIMDVLGWTRVTGLDDHNQSDTGATTVLGDAVAGINGSLELQGDHDWFKVTLDPAKHYQINIVGSTLPDPFLALYAGANASRDTDTPTQTDDDSGTGANSRLSIGFGNNGTFFVDVGANGDASSPKVADVGMGTYNVTLIGNTPPVLSPDTFSPHALTELNGVSNSSAPDQVSGVLGFTDPDITDTHTASASLSSSSPPVWSGGAAIPAASLTALGTAMTDAITLDGTSGLLAWQFSLQDKNVDFLAVNETLTAVYDLTLADHRTGSPFSDTSIRQVTVVFTGTNDLPVVLGSSTLANSLSELPNVTGSLLTDSTSGVIAFADLDLNDRPTPQAIDSSLQTVTWQDATHDYTAQLTAAQIPLLKAGFSITPQGGNTNTGNIDWAYNVVDKNLDFLGVGESLTIKTPVTIDDHNGGTVTANVVVTVNGANDPPVVVPDSNGVAKGAKLFVTAFNGVLANDFDPDAHDNGTLFVSQVKGLAANVGHSVAGTYGSLTLNADGSYVYAAKSGSLPSKFVPQDIFSYTVSDQHGGTDTDNLYIVLFNKGTIYLKGTNTTLVGSVGPDVLDGFTGHDILLGGNGPDVLIGGDGDTLIGGSQPDFYLFRPHFGTNTIADLTVGVDHIQFDKSIFASAFDILHNHTTDTPGGAVIDDGLGDTVAITGVHLAQLTLETFILA